MQVINLLDRRRSAIVPPDRQLTERTRDALRAAGFIVCARPNGHFAAALDRATFDSAEVVGDADPVAFTVRAMASHLESNARAIRESIDEPKDCG